MLANIHKVADVRFMHQNIFRNRIFLHKAGDSYYASWRIQSLLEIHRKSVGSVSSYYANSQVIN